MGVSMELDLYDVALLEAVQDCNLLTADQLSERINLSPTACKRRLRKLREAGVIRADVSLLNPSVLRAGITCIVHVSLESEQRDRLTAFRTQIATYEEVTQCYYVTGEADFVLVVVTSDMEAYGLFTERAFFGNQNIRSFHTFMVMKTVKYTTRIKLPDLRGNG